MTRRVNRKHLAHFTERVLQVLAERPGEALSAYEIAYALQEVGRRPYSAGVYKALQQLTGAGSVLHVHTLRKYLAWPDRGCGSWLLLVCERCGGVEPASGEGLSAVLEVAIVKGFKPARGVMECPGLCAACLEASNFD